jgi:hypothetical protein
VTAEEAERIMKEEEEKKKKMESGEIEEVKAETKEGDSNKIAPNSGNGGTTDKYSWY